MKHRIKVAYLLTPVEFGGSEKVSLTFLRNVDRTRFDIYPTVLIRPWEKDTVFVRQLEDAYPLYKLPVAIRPGSVGRDHLRVIRCVKSLHRYLSKRSVHILHTHGYFADIIGIPVSKLLGLSHISTCHGFISNNTKLAMYNMLDRFVLRFCDRIIVVSEGIKDELIKGGIRKSRITVIQNAIENRENYDPSLFSAHRKKMRRLLNIGDSEFLVGYVGRLSEEKGLRYLIEAREGIGPNGKPFKIVLIGEGPYRKGLEDLAKRKGLEMEVIFAGFHLDVEEWFAALDIFVLPSLTEGTPMSLLEAMSFGCPVIAARVGGVAKVIEDGVNGVLIGPGDSRMLAEKIEMFLNDPFMRRELGERAARLIEKDYNVHDWCRRIETEYNLAIRKNW